jgi:dihydroxyacid dehydratase/phosphogluconate dehydratase
MSKGNWFFLRAKHLRLIPDGRFSGGTHGFVVSHIPPEAYVGGLLAIIETMQDNQMTVFFNRFV